MKIQIEYPLIFGNDLCDGTWHDATVEELYLVGTGPFYLLKYFDEKYEEECLAVLLRSGKNFRKAPLVDYSSINALTGRILSLADANMLPDKIEASSDVSFDLADLTLRRMAAASPPPPPPLPPSGNNGGGNANAVRVYRVKNDSQLPSLRGQAWTVKANNGVGFMPCRIATLFIYENMIYVGWLDKNGFNVTLPSLPQLFHILSTYYIIWRRIQFSIITDNNVILGALNVFCNEYAKNGVGVTIREIDVESFEARSAGELPACLVNVAHRYNVRQIYHSQNKP